MEELNNEINSNGLKCERIKEEEKIVSKRFYCYECNFLFSQKSLLDTHMEKHCQFCCPNCEYTTYAEDEFKNHKQSHEYGELFHCSKCNFTSNRKEYLSKHERKHTRPYACEECDKTFTQELYLKAHFAKVHMKRKYFSCNEDNCSFTTDYESVLINHERNHTKPFMIFLKDHKNFTEIPALEHPMQDSNNNEKDYSISAERNNYTCASCDHNFKNHLHLKWHLLTHGNEKYFSCSKCKYKTKSSNHFKSHVKKHIRKHIGSQETANGILLENHIKLHKKENKNQKNDTIKEKEIDAEPLSCSVCYFKSMYKEVIQEHINTCHGVHAYICKICSYEANSESMLKSHMVTHENNMQNSTVSLDSYNEEPNNNYIVINKEDNTKSEEKSIYTCTKCGHNFDFLLHLKWHLLIHGDEKYFSCSECEYKTKHTYNFKKHSKQHIGKLLACQECNYTTEDVLLLLNHMKNHDERAFFSCNEDNCSFTTYYKSSLINHERSHTRPFLCKECGKGFTHEKIRDNHFLNDHRNVAYKQIDSEPETLSCSVCEFKCTSKADFHDHINDHHLKPAFICEICSYEVNSESMLKSHMVTHENNAFESSVALKELASEKKTYTCSTCKQNFNSNLHLKWHLLTHGDEKYFGCSECEYKTKKIYNFESHSKRHIGKVIACQECNYTTEDEILLVKHMKIHKKEKKKLGKRKYKNCKQKCELSFICSYCSVECASIKKLTKHIQNHDNSDLNKDPINKLQNCPAKNIEKCNISEQTNDTKLSEELVAWNNMEITNARENVIKTFSCGINGCEELFSSLGNLKAHIDIHKEEKVYNCNDCNYKCYTNHELEKHEYTHREHPLIECDISENNMKQFIYKNTVSSTNDTCTVVRKRCPKCKIWFSSKSDLARHLKSHTLHNMFTCNLCNYKDKRLYNVVIHKEKVHGQLSRLKCDMCSFKTCVLKRLEAHKLSHNSQTKIESKDANSEVQEKKHLISYGNMDSVHQIPTKKFSIKSKILSSVFNKNKKNKNSKSKTVKNLNKNKACSLCDSAFMARSGFCKHMYTPSKEKRWSCLLCPFKTHWAFSLKQHRIKMHSNENI